jgi:hypothetical protein
MFTAFCPAVAIWTSTTDGVPQLCRTAGTGRGPGSDSDQSIRWKSGVEGRLDLHAEGDAVADHYPAGLHHRLEVDAVVAALDLAPGRETSPVAAARVRSGIRPSRATASTTSCATPVLRPRSRMARYCVVSHPWLSTRL